MMAPNFLAGSGSANARPLDVPIPRRVSKAQSVASAKIQVHVEPDHLALNLGERASIEVEVFNGSAIVDEFHVDLLGPWVDPIRPEWVTVQPASLALFPNTSGVVLLTLDVPGASQLLAGRHLIGIRVRSTTDPDFAYVAELPVTVNSQPVASLHLDPQTPSGGSSATTHLVARNLGNVPMNLWFSTTDPASAVRFELAETEVPIGPDEEVRIPVVLRAKRPLIGSAAARPFSVQGDIEDRGGEVGAEAQPYVEAVRAEGTFSQSARINGRILSAIGLLLPVIAILVAAFILKPAAIAEELSGPLNFGVAGVVDRVQVRPNEFVLAGQTIATMSGTEADLAMVAAQLELRRAIVDLEGIKTMKFVSDAQAALDGQTPPPDPEFLQGLVQELQAATESALSVSSTALTGMTAALTRYCEGLGDARPVECDTQPVPLPSAFVAQLVQESATNPAAHDVVDANSNYRSASATLQAVQRLLTSAEEQLVAAGGDPSAPSDGGDAEPSAVAAAESQQAETEYELKLLEQQAKIAEAQLDCRAALQDVGRTTLRAPVDVVIVDVLITSGAQVDADSSVVMVERTDGRAFKPPAGLRAPSPQDLPPASCPGTIDELRAADIAQITDGSSAGRK